MALAVVLPLYWALMFVGTHLPSDSLPGVGASDKTLHFLGYSGLAFLLAAAWIDLRSRLVGAARVLLVVALYGALDEWSQRFVVGRQPDVGDWLADLVGCAGGLVCYLSIAWAYVRCGCPLGRGRPKSPSETA
jgi:VanZ family protein